MCNGFLYRIHYFYRKNIIQIFCSPVFFCRRNRFRHQCTGIFIRTHFHMLLFQALCQNRKKSVLYLAVYKKRFAGIAHTYTLCFGIDHNISSHLKICGFIHINMAVAGSCLDHRNRALVYDRFDQASSSPWYENVYICVHLHKFCCCLPGSIFDQLDRILSNPAGSHGFTDTFHNRGIGMNGITSTFQDDNISGFKAKSERIRSYIWACLINDPDHA